MFLTTISSIPIPFFGAVSVLSSTSWGALFSPHSKETPSTSQMVILVGKEILPGEELLISYIDESLPYLERRRALLDYGFECSCPKCLRKE